jgi:hypothetical protein
MSALSFLLPGCEIDSVRVGDCKIVIAAHSIKEAAVCPECALSSRRVHLKVLPQCSIPAYMLVRKAE